jgi:hypothetical protein
MITLKKTSFSNGIKAVRRACRGYGFGAPMGATVDIKNGIASIAVYDINHELYTMEVPAATCDISIRVSLSGEVIVKERHA